jgi:4-amino-4-deoxy-L-arabinose transferase
VSSVFRRPTSDDERIARRILFWWFIFPLLLFSISSSKLILYILPLSIGFSIVTGYYLSVNKSPKPLVITSLVIILIYAGLTLIPYSLHLRNTILLTIIPVVSLALSVAATYYGISRQKLITVWSGLFAACLIAYSSLFFRLNSDKVNTISDVSSFIKEKGLEKGHIVVYDELLPSMAFELNRDVVFLYGGNRSLQREVQFEENENWRSYLIDASLKPAGNLSTLLSGKSVLVTKKELPPNLSSIVERGWHNQVIGKWTVFYK